MKTISVVPDVPDWRNSVQAFLDKYQPAKPKKSEEFVKTKFELVVHEVDL